jgi:hypothetical protein
MWYKKSYVSQKKLGDKRSRSPKEVENHWTRPMHQPAIATNKKLKNGTKNGTTMAWHCRFSQGITE